MTSKRRISLALSSPWTVTLLLFWCFPLIYSFLVGFTDYCLLARDWQWVGLDNYKNLLTDSLFIDSLKNTFIFVVGTIPITTILALFLALLVNRNFLGRVFFRSAFFIPSITSMVVIALIFTSLYSRGGYISLLAEMIGLASPENGFLYDSRSALFSIMVMDIWMSVGYYMLIFLAGLKGIPDELYESAEIAGASPFRQFISITLPLLKPTVLFIIVINSIKSFQVFVEIFVMTQGKFDSSTSVYYIYEQGLTTGFQIGYSSAAAYILFVIIAIFSIAQFSLFKRGGQVW